MLLELGGGHGEVGPGRFEQGMKQSNIVCRQDRPKGKYKVNAAFAVLRNPNAS